MPRIIYTHCDFDGAATADIVSYIEKIEEFRFATPDNIHQQPVAGQDIVCDLPYISGCGAWFDHHASNIQEITDRGLNPQNLPGANAIAPSAARVAFEYFQKQQELPEHFTALADAADIIDTMAYNSIDDWLAPTPHNILNETININSESYPAMCHHLKWLTMMLRDKSITAIAEDTKIKERYKLRQAARQRDMAFLDKVVSFLPADSRQQILIINCSNLSFAPKFNKSLALVNYPHAEYVLLIASDFSYGRKTNNLKISLGKNFITPSDKQLGVFLEELGIGGGHDNAAGGIIRAKSKKERIKALERFQETLFDFVNE